MPIQTQFPITFNSRNSSQSLIPRMLTLSPLAYWPVDDAVAAESVLDVSGNGYHATPAGLTLGVAGIGDGNTAAEWGAASHLNLYSAELAAALSTQEFSALVWAKLPAASWDGSATRYLLRLGASDNNNAFEIYQRNVANTLVIRLIAGGTSDGNINIALNTTAWFQAALTVSKSNDRVRAYVNGVQAGNDATTLGTWAGAFASTRCTAGASSTTPASPLAATSRMAHIAVWNRELTLEEISGVFFN